MATTFLVAKNRAYSKLAAAITAGATTLTVTAGDGANFPSTYPFHLTIDDEIVSCTARSTDSLTIVRAQQGTSGVAHANKSYVSLNITAKSITDLNTAVNTLESYDVLTTRGDIIYRAASAPARLAKGADNTIMAMGANDPEWKTPAAIMGDLSGQAAAAFDFNAQDVKNIAVLQVNGATAAAYSRIGATGTTHSLTSPNDLLVSGKLEVDGAAFFDGAVDITGLQSSGAITIKPSGDTDDYFTFATVSDVPSLYGTGSYLRIGDAVTSTYGLSFEDDLMVSGKLEVKSVAYFNGVAEFHNGDPNDYLLITTTSNIPTIYGTGAYVRIGDAGTTAHSLVSEDDLMITGKLEVGGLAFLDSDVQIADTKAINTGVADDDYFSMGAVDNDTNTITELLRFTGGTPDPWLGVWAKRIRYFRPDISWSANQKTAFNCLDNQYGLMQANSSIDGGILLWGYNKQTAVNARAFLLYGYVENEPTGILGAIAFNIYKHDGAGALTAIADGSKLLAVGNNLVAKLILYGDGDLHIVGVLSTVGATPQAYSRFGDAATTQHSLVSEDDLMVTGKLEVGGLAFFDSDVQIADTKGIFTGEAASDYLIMSAYNTNDSARIEALRITNSAVASGLAILEITADFYLVEKAAAGPDIVGRGQWWVKNNTPNEPWFTGDDGVDLPLLGKVYPLANTYISGSGTAGADNTAQTVITAVIPANTITQLGDRLRVRVYFRGDTGGAVTMTCTVNGVTIASQADGGGTTWFMTETWLHYIDSTHANIAETGAGAELASGTANSAGFDWTSAQDVDCDQNQVSGNHIVVYAIFLDVYPKGLI